MGALAQPAGEPARPDPGGALDQVGPGAAIGVDLLGYNTEGGMTPQGELDAVMSTSTQQNSVAMFCATADGFNAGFEVWWGPIRSVSDSVPDGALEAMFTAGLDGVGLQEQLPIEASCAADRIAAVQATADRYHAVPGGSACEIDVQVMSSRTRSPPAISTPGSWRKCSWHRKSVSRSRILRTGYWLCTMQVSAP